MEWYYYFSPANSNVPYPNGEVSWCTVIGKNAMDVYPGSQEFGVTLEARCSTATGPGGNYTNPTTRSARLYVVNNDNSGNSYYCTISQIEWVDDNGGGGGTGDPIPEQ
jgi:hypothetical protein